MSAISNLANSMQIQREGYEARKAVGCYKDPGCKILKVSMAVCPYIGFSLAGPLGILGGMVAAPIITIAIASVIQSIEEKRCVIL